MVLNFPKLRWPPGPAGSPHHCAARVACGDGGRGPAWAGFPAHPRPAQHRRVVRTGNWGSGEGFRTAHRSLLSLSAAADALLQGPSCPVDHHDGSSGHHEPAVSVLKPPRPPILTAHDALTRAASTPATQLLDASLRPSRRLPLNAVLTHTDYAASAKLHPERPLNGAGLTAIALDERRSPRTVGGELCAQSAVTVALRIGDTHGTMAEVTISELRNHGNEVLDRVALGERLVITRSGKPIAELRPVPSPLLNATTLVERRRTLPVVDPDGLRSAVDHVVNAAL